MAEKFNMYVIRLIIIQFSHAGKREKQNDRIYPKRSEFLVLQEWAKCPFSRRELQSSGKPRRGALRTAWRSRDCKIGEENRYELY